ncbi:transcriptional elongation regulator MINIYO [Musa acuminata AAA Group]|uniref:transcriptional elongation regulator MINIYO n=1 Tax=Musa acuminata AAA Group TaxID=214697 RepID=UPI0031DB6224
MEAEKSAKKSRTSNKPRGPAFALKKIVHDLQHAPGLVGGIVEKGFPPSGEGSRKPYAVPLPRPTVLPFPVARQRSHGPHWAPVGSASVDAEEDDIEDDKDETDYDPIASFADPIERKKKESLDFSRWKEFVPQDDASVPQSKKEAKADAGKVIQVKKSSSAISEGKKEAIPRTSSPNVDMLDSEEMTLRDLMNRNFSAAITTTVEPKSIMGKLLSDAPRDSDLDSSCAVNDVPARPGQNHVINNVEMTEANNQGSSSLMDDIDAENLSRLKQMSEEDIAEARAEIMEKMDPALVEMLRKHGQKKLRSRNDIEHEQNKGQQVLVSTKLAESGKSTKPISNNSSWKAWSERVEKVRSLRFSLDGNVLEIDSAQHILSGDKPDVGPCSVENVAERDLLRTEGDPAALGYTIHEAVALTRSMIPGQRAIALKLLASVLSKALHNLQHMDNCSHVRKTNPVDYFVDWQAVWAFVLGPEPQMALSLRIALDDNHDSVVMACCKTIQSILSFDINEIFFDTAEKVTTSKKNTFMAPVFRSRPDADGGFLHGGYWKYNTKPSNILLTNEQNSEDDENEEQHTIQDDVVVAGQDVASGLVRMGVLPRICYLLEMDPLPALEESLVSIVVAVARHSPTCADAVMKCPNLIQTVVKIFTKQGVERYPSQIKAVLLLKVLSQANKRVCLDFVKHGVFQQAMCHWYKNVFTLESWVKSGREYCKLTSALMVEQLRLWRVFIQYGFCITYFVDFFPAMCLWLNPPTFTKIIGNDILGEFTSITREAYLVLEALAQRLPNLHSMDQVNKQTIDFSIYAAEFWSWNHVSPMIDLAISWLSLRDIPYISSLIADPKKSMSHVEVAPMASLLWVISAVLHMLCSILDRAFAFPCTHKKMDKQNSSLPWLRHFVLKIGLQIIKNGFLDILCSNKYEFEDFYTENGSLARVLCLLRQQKNVDVSLSSVSCLRGLVQISQLVDEHVRRAKTINNGQSFTEGMLGLPEKTLEEGIIRSAQNDLLEVLTLFIDVLSSEKQVLQSVEMFGRGGPAPGIGFGWGSCGGGFWSLNVLLAQIDSQLILSLYNIIPVVSENDPIQVESIRPDNAITLQRINSMLEICLLAGPGDEATLDKALDYLFHLPVLRYLGFCVNHFLHHMKFSNASDWQYGEEDYIFFSEILKLYYRERWLTAKRKTATQVHNDDIHKRSHALETIHEEIEPHAAVSRDHSSNGLLVEWAYQRLPLPMHWFLSAVCIMGDLKKMATCSPADVAKSGLFFFLGLEVMSSFLCSTSRDSLISGIPVVWKLHALSMALHVNMDVLGEERSGNVFKTLQDMYGQHIDQLKCGNMTSKDEEYRDFVASSSEAQVSGSQEVLNFQTTIHESYNTFVEDIVEQFCAMSYGDIIYGRQVAVYLHRTVEASVRLAMWNALSNIHALELLPPIGKCIAGAEGYLEPVEDKEEILEAYAKSWTSGCLEKASTRESVSFTLAVHHLSCFIFNTSASEKLAMRNKLAKSLLRSYSQKPHQETMLLTLLRYGLMFSQEPTYKTEVARRLVVLKEACDGNSSLLVMVEKLESLG